MTPDERLPRATPSALLPIVLFAIAKLAFHTFVNRHYGFHRDELATLDDARHLAWGYVAYPPLVPLIGRIALTIFGTSLAGFRFFAAAAQSVAIVFSASIAKHLGGDRAAQWITALCVAISGVSLSASSLFQYVSFDYLWWVVVAWLVVRLVESDDGRWWLAIGLAIGLGVMTKYTMGFLVAGLVTGVCATPLRRHLRGRWLWIGAALSVVAAFPHLLWQMNHEFITLDFLKHIHARDVRIGRTDHFLVKQLTGPANLASIPFWSAGLVALFASKTFRRFRVLGWMAVVPFVLFLVAKGRDYYTAPIYPALFAAGAVWLVLWAGRRGAAKAWLVAVAVPVLVLAGCLYVAVVTPVAPVGTKWWHRALQENGDLREEIGWPGLVDEVARIWQAVPSAERARTAIYCANYGEAGAIDLYGPAQGLPPAISGINSYWARGYGDPPPETVIVLGGHRERLEAIFDSVELAGRFPNPLGVKNEESEHPEIFVCRRLKGSWPELWPQVRGFG